MDGPLILICSTKLRSLTYIHAWVEKKILKQKIILQIIKFLRRGITSRQKVQL